MTTANQLAEAVERACRRLYADQFTGDAPLLMELVEALKGATEAWQSDEHRHVLVIPWEPK